eukprot:TRINITY_DN6060_c0_g1_i1.p1 TRINITY_DN6060_c0_g1~~TRINITY_DN6060_c0_g1_i1.p1  ORF type:complete len:103 (-),score=3.15 TRINITY_DN6060_c0_g1_i1:259-567(-)
MEASESAQTMNLEGPNTCEADFEDPITSQLHNIYADGTFAPIVLDEAKLHRLDPSTVFTVKYGDSEPTKHYRSVLPEIALSPVQEMLSCILRRRLQYGGVQV